MSEQLTITIRNWDRFQHYKDRDPPWIKNYTALLHDESYRELSMADRGVLHGLWLEYASSHRVLRGDTASITRRLGQRVTRTQLERLNDAGFIEVSASSALAYARSRDVERSKGLKQKPAMPAVARPLQAGRQSYPQPSEPVENPWAIR